MKKFLLTIIVSMLTFISFATNVVEVEKYNNGNTKYELISHSTVDGDIFEYSSYYESGVIMLKGMYNEYGNKYGYWTTFHENGQIESSVFYNNGVKHGKCLYYSEEGSIIAQSQYKFGKRHGIWIEYNGSKIITHREYKNDKSHGVWKQYDSEGEILLASDEYKRGKLIKGWTWNEFQGLIARQP